MTEQVRLGGSEELEAALERVQQLEGALRSRIIIEQAKGVLAERLQLTPEDAFVVLRSGARSARLNIHELAHRVVEERETPTPIVVAIAKTQRLRSSWMLELNEAHKETLQHLRAALSETRERLAEDRGRRERDRRRRHPS